MSVNKILFVGLSCVGDVIMTTPVMQSLHTKYPEALFDIVTDKRAMQLYGNYPFLNKLYIKDKDKPLRGVPGLLLQLWKNRYDIIVDVRQMGWPTCCEERKDILSGLLKVMGLMR